MGQFFSVNKGDNMNKINYQKQLDKLLEQLKIDNKKPSLLLHICCAPCNSYVLEYLNDYFDITVFFYNPNISYEDEYKKRVNEELKFLKTFPLNNAVKFVEGKYDPESFYAMAKGRESLPEGGERCYSCYELRLKEAAIYASQNKFDYYTTSLSISPYKNADWLNEIGTRLGNEYGVEYLMSDFKKKNGYKRSIELSRLYNLYRQDYCGCVYSKMERENNR